MLKIQEILDKKNQIIKYELNQNPENALVLMECINLILDMYEDEEYGPLIKEIFIFDLKQNSKAAINKLKTIQLSIEIESDLESIYEP